MAMLMYAERTSLMMNTARDPHTKRHASMHSARMMFLAMLGPMMMMRDPMGSNGLSLARIAAGNSGSRLGWSRALPTGRWSARRTGRSVNEISHSPCLLSSFDGWYSGIQCPSAAASRMSPNSPMLNHDFSWGIGGACFWFWASILTSALPESSPSGAAVMSRIRSLHMPESGTTASPMLSLDPMRSRSYAETRSLALVTGMENR
mmetsp:Transcript_11870/g.55155  ORF Transcript_11870/g.55155 Transcript_11870/m.55155 type:complete len:205 (-) Transcript_11870:363-977(-)